MRVAFQTPSREEGGRRETDSPEILARLGSLHGNSQDGVSTPTFPSMTASSEVIVQGFSLTL